MGVAGLDATSRRSWPCFGWWYPKRDWLARAVDTLYILLKLHHGLASAGPFGSTDYIWIVPRNYGFTIRQKNEASHWQWLQITDGSMFRGLCTLRSRWLPGTYLGTCWHRIALVGWLEDLQCPSNLYQFVILVSDRVRKNMCYIFHGTYLHQLDIFLGEGGVSSTHRCFSRRGMSLTFSDPFPLKEIMLSGGGGIFSKNR